MLLKHDYCTINFTKIAKYLLTNNKSKNMIYKRIRLKLISRGPKTSNFHLASVKSNLLTKFNNYHAQNNYVKLILNTRYI